METVQFAMRIASVIEVEFYTFRPEERRHISREV